MMMPEQLRHLRLFKATEDLKLAINAYVEFHKPKIPMKAITLYEPYASLMAIGAKTNETRPMRTAHRGDICIHAAKKSFDFDGNLQKLVQHAFASRNEPIRFNHGFIVAVVEIYDVHPSDNFFRGDIFTSHQKNELSKHGMICIPNEEYNFGDYSLGRFIYRTRNLRRLKTPVPAKGMQCVGWTVPEDVAAKVRAQL